MAARRRKPPLPGRQPNPDGQDGPGVKPDPRPRNHRKPATHAGSKDRARAKRRKNDPPGKRPGSPVTDEHLAACPWPYRGPANWRTDIPPGRARQSELDPRRTALEQMPRAMRERLPWWPKDVPEPSEPDEPRDPRPTPGPRPARGGGR